ncbi:MAG: hypothetical protein KGL10_06730 [Alphaproteobacteria bacterium]|nr:hypothetical protein [Alphaproteobacteria bacterium]MDE2336988.1 hypothetical protein [Alphaproteobacteria bacterium]
MKDFRALSSGSCLKAGLALLIAAFSLCACADHMPMPGGTEDINSSCFKSIDDMQTRILSMKPGMPEDQVLAQLCRKKEDLTRLTRQQIRVALLGGSNVTFPGLSPSEDSQLIESLYGYTLSYKSINREHGFVNPIRIRTNETGFDYNVTLVFRDGKLFSSPLLAGGPVDTTTSGTLFDFITPGTVVNKLP